MINVSDEDWTDQSDSECSEISEDIQIVYDKPKIKSKKYEGNHDEIGNKQTFGTFPRGILKQRETANDSRYEDSKQSNNEKIKNIICVDNNIIFNNKSSNQKESDQIRIDIEEVVKNDTQDNKIKNTDKTINEEVKVNLNNM